MQTLYRNERKPLGPWLLLVLGPLLLALVMVYLAGIAPVFANNAVAMWVSCAVGLAFVTAGFISLMRWVTAIMIAPENQLVVMTAIGQSEIAASQLQSLRLATKGKDDVRMTLATNQSNWSFPSGSFAAERIVETVKAMNPAVRVDRTG